MFEIPWCLKWNVCWQVNFERSLKRRSSVSARVEEKHTSRGREAEPAQTAESPCPRRSTTSTTSPGFQTRRCRSSSRTHWADPISVSFLKMTLCQVYEHWRLQELIFRGIYFCSWPPEMMECMKIMACLWKPMTTGEMQQMSRFFSLEILPSFHSCLEMAVFWIDFSEEWKLCSVCWASGQPNALILAHRSCVFGCRYLFDQPMADAVWKPVWKQTRFLDVRLLWSATKCDIVYLCVLLS